MRIVEIIIDVSNGPELKRPWSLRKLTGPIAGFQIVRCAYSDFRMVCAHCVQLWILVLLLSGQLPAIDFSSTRRRIG